jgi:hypothetical protein
MLNVRRVIHEFQLRPRFQKRYRKRLMPMIRSLLFFLVLTCGSLALAGGPHTPAIGSAERQAILDAARVRVALDLSYSGAILFRVEHLNVYQGWALLNGQPVTPKGQPIHKNCIESDELTIVLLRFRDGAWQVERGGTTCATDVFWLQWQDELGAPGELFALEGG